MKNGDFKRFLSSILVFATLLGLLVFSPAVSAGTSGDWEYSVSDGKALITYYKGSDADVTIPSELDGYPVMGTGGSALANKSSLTSVTFPDGATIIGGSTFHSCQSLRSVTVPASVASIAWDVFYNCTAFTDIYYSGTWEDWRAIFAPDIPAGITVHCTDGDFVVQEPEFKYSLSGAGATLLKYNGEDADVTIPSELDGYHVTKIGYGAFLQNNKISSVKVPEGVTQIDKNAFSSCTSLERVELPDSVTDLAYGVFKYCSSLDGITLPENVTSLEASVFEGCTSLKSIEIPESMTEIGKFMFYNCTALSDVTLPDSVETIRDYAFSGCSSLESITIPSGVTSIGFSAFSGCSSIRSITIPSGVTTIGYYAFSGCSALTEVRFEGTRENWNAMNVTLPDGVTVRCSDDPTVTFKDVPADAYYKVPVDWAVANNITAGTGPNTFSPDEGCTRGQVVTFLWRAAGQPEPTGTNNPFRDVKADDYFYKAVLWAVEKGVTAGTSKTTFSPNDVCTRGQIVTFQWRANDQPAPKSSSNPFIDVKTDDYFFSAVLWAVEKGITLGTDAKHFSPTDTCTRGQVVTFLFRDANN